MTIVKLWSGKGWTWASAWWKVTFGTCSRFARWRASSIMREERSTPSADPAVAHRAASRVAWPEFGKNQRAPDVEHLRGRVDRRRSQELVAIASDPLVETIGTCRPVSARVAVPGGELLEVRGIDPRRSDSAAVASAIRRRMFIRCQVLIN